MNTPSPHPNPKAVPGTGALPRTPRRTGQPQGRYRSPQLSARTVNQHAPTVPLKGTFNWEHDSMTSGKNAGIKRNRRPTGTKTVAKKINIAPETQDLLDQARIASGNLSLSLYLELLTRQIEHEFGSLPVLRVPATLKEGHPAAA